jgi:hypothetical protein
MYEEGQRTDDHYKTVIDRNRRKEELKAESVENKGESAEWNDSYIKPKALSSYIKPKALSAED